MKVVGYIRVSTEEQASEGASLAAQRERIKKWAEMHDHEVAAIYEDAGISGKSQEGRPGLAAALAACSQGSVLVFYSISRLARSITDLFEIAERLKKQRAMMASLTEPIDTTNATGRLIYGVLGLLAQFERELIGERTRMGMAQKKAQGVRFGPKRANTAAACAATKARWERYRRDRGKS